MLFLSYSDLVAENNLYNTPTLVHILNIGNNTLINITVKNTLHYEKLFFLILSKKYDLLLNNNEINLLDLKSINVNALDLNDPENIEIPEIPDIPEEKINACNDKCKKINSTLHDLHKQLRIIKKEIHKNNLIKNSECPNCN